MLHVASSALCNRAALSLWPARRRRCAAFVAGAPAHTQYLARHSKGRQRHKKIGTLWSEHTHGQCSRPNTTQFCFSRHRSRRRRRRHGANESNAAAGCLHVGNSERKPASGRPQEQRQRCRRRPADGRTGGRRIATAACPSVRPGRPRARVRLSRAAAGGVVGFSLAGRIQLTKVRHHHRRRRRRCCCCGRCNTALCTAAAAVPAVIATRPSIHTIFNTTTTITISTANLSRRSNSFA